MSYFISPLLRCRNRVRVEIESENLNFRLLNSIRLICLNCVKNLQFRDFLGTAGAKSYLVHNWGTLGTFGIKSVGAQLGHTWGTVG